MHSNKEHIKKFNIIHILTEELEYKQQPDYFHTIDNVCDILLSISQFFPKIIVAYSSFLYNAIPFFK